MLDACLTNDQLTVCSATYVLLREHVQAIHFHMHTVVQLVYGFSTSVPFCWLLFSTGSSHDDNPTLWQLRKCQSEQRRRIWSFDVAWSQFNCYRATMSTTKSIRGLLVDLFWHYESNDIGLCDQWPTDRVFHCRYRSWCIYQTTYYEWTTSVARDKRRYNFFIRLIVICNTGNV